MVNLSPPSLRVVFFGTMGQFSASTFATLLAARVDVCAVVVPALPNATDAIAMLPPASTSVTLAALPMVDSNTANVVQQANDHNIPVFAVRRLRAPATRSTLAALQPDVACVACFPRRIPPELLALPQHGFLNVHPSLLPAHRGPNPLFWTFRSGELATGVTIHAMDATFDTGDIVAQHKLDLPVGSSGREAEQRCATLGGELLVDVLQAAHSDLVCSPQAAGGGYEGLPTAQDFVLNTHWSAQRAFGFMCGTAEWGQSYPITVGATTLRLRKAHDYNPTASLGCPFVRAGDTVHVQCMPGVLTAQLALR